MCTARHRLWSSCLLLLLAASTNASAQARAASRTASLHVTANARGDAELRLELSFTPNDPDEIVDSLNNGFDGRLSHVETEANADNWTLRAHCEAAFRRHELVASGSIDPEPLRRELGLHGVANTELFVTLPRVGFIDCSAPTSTDRVPAEEDRRFQVEIANNPLAAPVQLTFGYKSRDFLRFLPLAILLAVPILLTLWMSYRATRSDADPYTVWFGCWRFQRRLTLGCWCLWLVVLPAVDAVGMVGFGFGKVNADSDRALAAGFCAIFVMVLLFSGYLVVPAFVRLEGMDWTRPHVRSLYVTDRFSLGAVLSMAAVISYYVGDSPSFVLGLFFLAFILAVGAHAVKRGQFFMNGLRQLAACEMRDRLTEMARTAGVHVQGTFIVPSGPWRLLNALAGPGPFVYISQSLTEKLSEREIDTVLAHQIVRLRSRRAILVWVILTLVVTTVLMAVVDMGLSLILRSDLSRWAPLQFLPLVFSIAVFRCRSLRYAAYYDLEAAEVCDDPEGLLVALTKMRSQKLLPEAGDPWVSEESAGVAFQGRLEALADRERISVPSPNLQHPLAESIQAAPGTALTITERRRELLEFRPEGEFSTAFRTRIMGPIFWTLWSMTALIPALLAFAVQRFAWHGSLAAAIYVLGLLLVAALDDMLVSPFFAFRGYRRLKERLRAKVEAQGDLVASTDGVFVGLSPGRVAQIHGGFWDWDVGFIFLEGDRLYYVGDQLRFALRRDQIEDIAFAVRVAAWRDLRRLRIVWRGDENISAGAFNMQPLPDQALGDRNRAVREFAERLISWWKHPAPVKASSEDLPEAPPPEFPPTAGYSPHSGITPYNLVVSNLIPFFLSLPLCFALGLSFDPRQGGAAWYVICVIVIAPLLRVIPFWKHRDVDP
jgi:Zn-dependent protease with chaperone function